MTRLVYIADFSQDWYTPVHLARDAEAVGCQVVRVEEPREHSQFPDLCKRVEYEAHRIDAKLVLYTKTFGLPDEAHAWWGRLERLGARTASFHLDIYRGLPRESEIGVDPFWTVSTVFTADGDPNTRTEMEMLGINHRWLPPGCVSDECIQVEPEPVSENVAEIVFVGSSRSYHPEWPWRMEMLAALRRRYGQAFQAIPDGGPRVHGLALNRLYQAPGRIVVGDSLCLPGHRNYFSDRYFETLGRGGFLIAPRVPGLEKLLQDGGHFVGYDSGDLPGLLGLIDAYRDAPDVARTIADAGQAHVAAHHTYKNRVREMLSVLGLREIRL